MFKSKSTKEQYARPFLSDVFYVIGAFEIASGVILCVFWWPGTFRDSVLYGSKLYGSNADFIYLPSFAALIGGFISGLLFFAIGSALEYLHIISKNLDKDAQQTISQE